MRVRRDIEQASFRLRADHALGARDFGPAPSRPVNLRGSTHHLVLERAAARVPVTGWSPRAVTGRSYKV